MAVLICRDLLIITTALKVIRKSNWKPLIKMNLLTITNNRIKIVLNNPAVIAINFWDIAHVINFQIDTDSISKNNNNDLRC